MGPSQNPRVYWILGQELVSLKTFLENRKCILNFINFIAVKIKNFLYCAVGEKQWNFPLKLIVIEVEISQAIPL